MKKLVFTLAFLCYTLISLAQVTILPSGITPSQGGGGIDRLTTTQRKALTGQNAGKLVFDIDQGHLYVWNGAAWRQILDASQNEASVVEKQSSSNQTDDRFGFSVAIKSKWAVVGAPGEDGGEGEAYIFERKQNGWEEVKRLRQDFTSVNNLLFTGARFGHAVDIDVMTVSGIEYPVIVVGAPGGNKAFVYRMSMYQIPNTSQSFLQWNYETFITHPSPVSDDLFGQSVAIHQNRIIVGVPQDDPSIGTNTFTNHGSACIYHAIQSATPQPNATFTWQIKGSISGQATLFRTSGATGDNFGASVDISGDIAVVSSPNATSNDGRVDMYRYEAGTDAWIFMREFTRLNLSRIDAVIDAGSFIGRQIALFPPITLVIGVPGDNSNAADAGAIQVVKNTTSSWTSTSVFNVLQIVNPYPVANSRFGTSVAVSSTSVLGGAPEWASPVANIGLASSFSNNDVYTHEKIENPFKEATTGRWFGRSVAISDEGTFVIGATPDSGWAGRVYFGNIKF